MPEPDCIILGAVEVGLGGEGVVILGVEDVGHRDGLVRPVAGSRVDVGLSNSGLRYGAAAASNADLQQTAGASWNRLAAVHSWLDSRLHQFPCREMVTLGPRGWIEEVPDSIRNQDHLPPQEYLHHQRLVELGWPWSRFEGTHTLVLLLPLPPWPFGLDISIEELIIILVLFMMLDVGSFSVGDGDGLG